MKIERVRLQSKQQIIILVIIFAAAFILRGIYLLEITKNPQFESADARFHNYWAKGLAFDEWTVPENFTEPEIQKTPYTKPPLYPYFLALIYKIVGPNYTLVVIVQMLLGLVNAALAFILAKRWFGGRIALISAALMGTYWIFIYFEGLLLAPVVIVFLSLCMMLALDSWTKKFTFLNSVVAGILFGLATLARPNILLFGPAVIGWAVWLKFKNRQSRIITALTSFILGSIVTIAPATIRNYLVCKDFVLVTSSVGINLYIGNNEETSCISPKIPNLAELIRKVNWTPFDCHDIHKGIERKVGREMKPSEVSKYFSQKALDFMKKNPGQTLRLTFKKALFFWGPSEVSNNSEIELEKQNSYLLKYLPNFPVVLSLFLLGSGMLCVNIRKQRKVLSDSQILNRQLNAFILILLFIVIYFASYLPFFSAARFRVPVIPFMIIPAAYGIDCIIQSISRRDSKVWIVAVVLYAIACYDFVEYEPNVVMWHQRNALVLLDTGQTEKAIEECLKAYQLNPNDPSTLFWMGRAYFQKQDYNSALTYWKKAVSIEPNDPRTHAWMGDAFSKLSEFDNAFRHWFIAASLDPKEPLYFYNIGQIYQRKGMLDKAIENYKKALLIDPNHQKAKNSLTSALQQRDSKN